MPRRKAPEIGEITHVTVRCNNGEFFFDLENQFDSITSWINCLPAFFDISIHHVLFMSNHIHLLITPQSELIGNAFSYLLTNLSKYLNHSNQRSNHIFGNRYAPTVIKDERHLANVIRYIYQNPVRAGILQSPFDYPYSSLGFYVGTTNPMIFLKPDPTTTAMFKSGLDGRHNWITAISNDLDDNDTELMRQCLSRSMFQFSQKQLQRISKKGSSLVI